MEIRNPENGNWELVNTGYLPKKLQGVNYILKSPKMFVAVNFAFEVTIRHPFRSQVFKAGVFSQLRQGSESNFNMMRTMMTEDMKCLFPTICRLMREPIMYKSQTLANCGQPAFFFNQMRGLQVVDLSNPQIPTVEARYRLPASGEQMYLLENGKYAVLICRTAHQDWPDYHSEIRILKINENIISEIKRIKLNGYYHESRIVGDRLYLVTQKWEKDKIIEKGWGFSIPPAYCKVFDLTDPESPEELSEQIIPGSAEVINANNSSLFGRHP